MNPADLSRFLFDVLSLAVLYLIARSSGMVLTTGLFHTGAIVLLVALVVTFQEDVRRGLRQLPLAGTFLRRRFRRSETEREAEIELLVEVCQEMAAKRIGALIVLVGSEPISGHVSNGIVNGGELSRGLLLNVFYPGSPGHDGAVIIERGRLWQFAAHLPLARQPLDPELGGTRHRAAVGLTEHCDALVIAVSEERGVISVAESGGISVMADGGRLHDRLSEFYRSRLPQTPTSRREWFGRRLPLKLAAIALAVLAWSQLVARPGTVHRTFAVPVEYRNLRPGLRMTDDATDEVRVTLSGPEIAFQSLDPSLLRLSFDVSRAAPGEHRRFAIPDGLNHPPRLEVESIAPREVTFTIEGTNRPQ